jgi:hypothetical protein
MATSPSTNVSPWTSAGGLATLQSDSLSARLDIARPQAGCHDVHFRGAPLNLSRWLAVFPASPAPVAVEDVFIRGGDLVVTYAESPQWPVRWQVYWRLLSEQSLGPALAGLELIVSAQTSLLDSSPAMLAETELSGPGSLVSLEAGIVTRLANTELSYIQLVHPADFRGTDVQSTPDHVRLAHPLFSKFLEKGVILRARLRGLLAESAAGESAFDTCWRLFRDSPTPLTV